MNKIGLSIIGILLIVGAIFFFSNNAPQSTLNDVNKDISVNTIETNLAGMDAPDLPTPLDETLEDSAGDVSPIVLNPVNALLFKDVIYDSYSEGYALRGQVYTTPESDVKGITIKLFCNGLYQSETLSLTDGTFEVKAPCVPGNEAYVKAEFDGNTYESRHMMLTNGFKHHSVTGVAASTALTAAGVPEFSLMTLGIAMVLTTLGIVYLRKK
jgi:hypothetical protein